MTPTKISDSEYTVMELLWDNGRPMSLGEIHEQLSPLHGWKYTTVSTFLLRLTAKKAVCSEKHNGSSCYVPLISKEQYRSAQTKAFISECHKGSLKSLVLALCDDEGDTAHLRKILADLEGGDGS